MKIDINELRAVCAMKTKHFKKVIPYNSKGNYWFQDNGANILAVGHLDSVQEFRHFHEMRLPHLHRVYCPVLDDRLGVYIITKLLPKLGLKYDILLTTDEEIGRSTAGNFTTTKEYNWIFEFDRKSEDMVMYKYQTPELKASLEKLGWKVGYGSYTDICDLEFLECKGFNFGTGYENYHSLDAYVDLKVMHENVQKFFLFYNKFKEIQLPHKTTYHFSKRSYTPTYNNYYTQDWEDEYKCDKCSGTGWINGKECGDCDGDGWLWGGKKDKKKNLILTNPPIIPITKAITTIKCMACGDTGISSNGKKCVCVKKTIPTLSDIYSYSCSACGSYIEIDIDTASDNHLEAAESNLCKPCYDKVVYFT